MHELDEYQGQLAAYALEALDQNEVLALEQHLESCAACRAELIQFREAAALLAHASPPVAPSDDLRERILAAARPSESQAAIVPISSRARESRWPLLLRIAAVFVIGALIIGLFVMWRQEVRSRREIASLARRLQRAETRSAQEREALTLLGSRDSKKMELAGTQAARQAGAMFVFDQKTGRAVLITDGLPATPAAKAYEVWFIPKGHQPMPGKMFTVDASGHAMLIEQMPVEAMESAVIAITLEPEAGSGQPTGAIYLSSSS